MIACHGSTGGDLLASDKKRVKLRELQELVNCEEAQAFRNCPKLFIVSACRADIDIGDDVLDSLHTDAPSSSHNDKEAILTSFAADFYTAFATVEGSVAYRHIREGTCFIQTICDVWEHEFYSISLSDLMRRVNVYMRKIFVL